MAPILLTPRGPGAIRAPLGIVVPEENQFGALLQLAAPEPLQWRYALLRNAIRHSLEILDSPWRTGERIRRTETHLRPPDLKKTTRTTRAQAGYSSSRERTVVILPPTGFDPTAATSTKSRSKPLPGAAIGVAAKDDEEWRPYSEPARA